MSRRAKRCDRFRGVSIRIIFAKKNTFNSPVVCPKKTGKDRMIRWQYSLILLSCNQLLNRGFKRQELIGFEGSGTNLLRFLGHLVLGCQSA